MAPWALAAPAANPAPHLVTPGARACSFLPAMAVLQAHTAGQVAPSAPLLETHSTCVLLVSKYIGTYQQCCQSRPRGASVKEWRSTGWGVNLEAATPRRILRGFTTLRWVLSLLSPLQLGCSWPCISFSIKSPCQGGSRSAEKGGEAVIRQVTAQRLPESAGEQSQKNRRRSQKRLPLHPLPLILNWRSEFSLQWTTSPRTQMAFAFRIGSSIVAAGRTLQVSAKLVMRTMIAMLQCAFEHQVGCSWRGWLPEFAGGRTEAWPCGKKLSMSHMFSETFPVSGSMSPCNAFLGNDGCLGGLGAGW